MKVGLLGCFQLDSEVCFFLKVFSHVLIKLERLLVNVMPGFIEA